MQVVDGAGNVAWAANKGPGFNPVPPPPPGPAVTMTPAPPASGWFASPPQITITPAGAPDVDVSIDGSAPEPYTGPFTPAGLASGSHVVTAAASDGGTCERCLPPRRHIAER